MTATRGRSSARLQLLGGFAMSVDGRVIRLQPTVQKLLAFLGLRDQPARRSFVAGRLWPEASEQQAAARLRSALWRFGYAELVDADANSVSLSRSVAVDVRGVVSQARRLVHDEELEPEDYEATLLRDDLLPDWWDDWLLLERERIRQIRLHALEALANRLVLRGRPGEGVAAALDAVAAEPLRESAHRVLVSAYLAEGNYGEAIRHYHLCAKLLKDELGVEPTVAMRSLVGVPSTADTPVRPAGSARKLVAPAAPLAVRP